MKPNCTICHYAEFKKTSTGRRMLDQPGKCNFPPIVLPHSYIQWTDKEVPQKREINKYTKSNCPCWKKIEKTLETNTEATT